MSKTVLQRALALAESTPNKAATAAAASILRRLSQDDANAVSRHRLIVDNLDKLSEAEQATVIAACEAVAAEPVVEAPTPEKAPAEPKSAGGNTSSVGIPATV